MSTNIPVKAQQYFPDKLPLPDGVDKLVSPSKFECRDCGHALPDHGWIGSRKVCPGYWVMLGNIYSPTEFRDKCAEMRKAGQAPAAEGGGETPWN